METQNSGSDIITIDSNNYFDEVKEIDQQENSLGRYAGIEMVKHYDEVKGI